MIMAFLDEPRWYKNGGGGEWVMVSSWKRLFSEVLKGDYFGLIGILAFEEDLFLPNYAELGYP